MKAIVCVKQVPDTSGKVSVKPMALWTVLRWLPSPTLMT